MPNVLYVGHFFTYFAVFILEKAVKMLEFVVFLSIFSIFLYFWRKTMINYLSVSSRDVRALYAIRMVLKLLWADENLAVFDARERIRPYRCYCCLTIRNTSKLLARWLSEPCARVAKAQRRARRTCFACARAASRRPKSWQS